MNVDGTGSGGYASGASGGSGGASNPWGPDDWNSFGDLAGSGLGLIGAIFDVFGGITDRSRERKDLRGDAAFIQEMAQDQYDLAAAMAAEARDNALTDVRLESTMLGGSIDAGAAASGVRSASGSVGTMQGFRKQQTAMAEGDIFSDYDFSMRQAALTRDQALYQADELLEQERYSRSDEPWMIAGDVLGAVGSAVDTAVSLAMMFV